MIWKSRRPRRRSPRLSFVTSLPSNRIAPEVGFSSATTSRPIVVLPQPDSPTRPNVSPSRTEKETSETALTLPILRCRTAPAVTGNSLTRLVDLDDHLAGRELVDPFQGDPARLGGVDDAKRAPGRRGAAHRVEAGEGVQRARRQAAAPRAGTGRSRCGTAVRTCSRRTPRSGRAGPRGCCRGGRWRRRSAWGWSRAAPRSRGGASPRTGSVSERSRRSCPRT